MSIPPTPDLDRAGVADQLGPAAAALGDVVELRDVLVDDFQDLSVVGDHRRRLAGRHLEEARPR